VNIIDGKNTTFLLYQTPDGQTRLEVRLQDETVWLSLTDMSNLFQRDKSVISRHIRNIFAEDELVRDSVIANFATTAADGKTYQVKHFNLDVGFTLDDERLKRGGGNYFDELLARIRAIRFDTILMKTPAKQDCRHANHHQP